jgi:glycerate dehydrogenase
VKIKIVFLDRASAPEHIDIARPNIDCEWVDYPSSSEAQVVERAHDAQIIVTNKVPLSAATISRLPRLQHIAVYATGFNIIDIQTCLDRGISVSNTPDYARDSVPEHALAMILALRRNLFHYHKSVRDGFWQSSAFFHGYSQQTFDLRGAQLGIFGGGCLGVSMARLGKALGMKVVFADRKHTQASGRGSYQPFDEVIRNSDVLSLHCPLTKDTENLIAMREFTQMKPQALLINTARGGIVNEVDLVAALNTDLIAGAGFDVASVEPITADNPLLSLVDRSNFILTPHVAWSSDAALKKQADILIQNIEGFLQGEKINQVT